jgi:hypothetical protein
MGGPTSMVLVVFDVMPYAVPVRVLKVGSVLAHSYALRVNLLLVHTDVSCSLAYILRELSSLIRVSSNGGRVAQPSLVFFPVAELWVPCPCVFCKGGYERSGRRASTTSTSGPQGSAWKS